MLFDLATLTARQRHKLVTGVVVPRPIAWTTTRGTDGQVNVAPYSFFNVMGNDPALVVLSPGNRADGTPKDTARIIAETQSFVVNIVDDHCAAQMNITAGAFPPDFSEAEAAGLTLSPMPGSTVPRIEASPAALACRLVTTLQVEQTRVVVGRVTHLFLRDDLVDAAKYYVHTDQLGAIGRMHGGGWYARTSDLFQLDRPTKEDVEEMVERGRSAKED